MSKFKNFTIDELCPSAIENVVAVEITNNGEGEIFIRTKNSQIETRREKFFPFILLESWDLLKGDDAIQISPFKIVDTIGRQLSAIAKFADIESYEKALSYLKKTTGFTPSSPNAPYKIFNDFVQQFLILNQLRFFRSMTFREICRLQFDIETLLSEGYEFPNPERPDDKIAIICLKDNCGWEKTIILDENNGGEKKLLEDFVSSIRERDPDVIEGYNIFRFDLPFLEKRATMHGVKLLLGRDGSRLKSRASRMNFAERTISYTRYDAYGRQFADIYFMVQLYDISHRDLEDFNLKSVARHLGVVAKNRTYIEHEDIPTLFWKAPDKLAQYCMDDVRETDSVSQILSPSYFYQAQILPFSYQNCVLRGNATKIDAMILSDYIVSGSSIPYPEAPRAFEGALTEAFESGIFENVWHCDIRSLYPSILIASAKSPSRDHKNLFLKLLLKLRDFRLLAKDASRTEQNNEKREFFDALQNTFKILINSFYGYLGFAQGAFNDYALAAAVTATGRQILGSMTDFLQKIDAKVIEIDTDGIYFCPPTTVSSTVEMQKMIQGILPDGIEVELDNTYKAMFCYKSKNYALLLENGEISITGAALKSRGLEPFQREYISKMIEKLLKKDYVGAKNLIKEYQKAIKNREFPLAKLAKTETLQDSLDSYLKKLQDGIGRRSAAYELALKSGRHYKQGDQISYYIVGLKKKLSVVDNCRLLTNAPAQRDENIEYYLGKLEELEKKFSDFLPKETEETKQNDDLFV